MTLTLHVTHYHNLPPEKELSFSMERSECTLGRGEDNDFVLVDPERIISHKHATIQYRDGSYYLTDNSTNGTFVNHAAKPLGQGQSVILQDGDVLTVGEYECRLSISPPAVGAEPKPPFEYAPAEQAEPPWPEPGEPPKPPAVDTYPPTPEPFPAGPEPAAPFPPLEGKGSAIPADYDFLADEFETPEPPTSRPVDHVPPAQEYFRPPEPMQEREEPLAAPPQPPAAPRPDAFGKRADTPAPPAFEQPTPPPEPAIRQRAPGTEDAGFAAFCKGAKLPVDGVVPDAIPGTLELAGQLLREMTTGLKQLMDARTSLKGEFRLEATSIRPAENNPLKFSLDVEDALRKLLLGPEKGYLPPIEAVQEAVHDLQAHQMAFLAGLRGALTALVSRFDPNSLEERFEGHSLIKNPLPGAREAKYWKAFRDLYGQVAEDAENDFMYLLGQEFSRAYQGQLASLRRAQQNRSMSDHQQGVE